MISEQPSPSLDEQALLAALNARAAQLRSFLASKIPAQLQSKIGVDDLLQEIWIAAFHGRNNFRIDRPDAADRWITSIAQSRLLNAIKSAKRVKRGGRERFQADVVAARSYADLFARIASPVRTPSSETAVREASDAVRIALAGLPDARREVVVLRYIAGKSCEQIAVMTRRSKAAVNSLLYNGLRQLQSKLGSATQYLSDAASDELPLHPSLNTDNSIPVETKESRR